MKKISILILTIICTTSLCQQNCKAFADNMSDDISIEVVPTYVIVPQYVIEKAIFNNDNLFINGELVIIPRNIVEIDGSAQGYIFGKYVGSWDANSSEVLVLVENYEPRKWSINNDQIGKIASN